MGDTNLEIRRFTRADEDAVFGIHLKAIVPEAHLINEDSSFKHIEELYIKSGGDFFVGCVGDKIVACGGLKKISDSTAEIIKIRIDPAFQRRGYGQAILNKLETRAVELGFNTLELNTALVQKSAQKMYEKNGYLEYKRGLLDGIPNIYYKKQL